MMRLALIPTTQFKKNYKRAKKRELDMGLLESALDTLCAGEHLPESARDHALTGNRPFCLVLSPSLLRPPCRT